MPNLPTQPPIGDLSAFNKQPSPPPSYDSKILRNYGKLNKTNVRIVTISHINL